MSFICKCSVKYPPLTLLAFVIVIALNDKFARASDNVYEKQNIKNRAA